MDVAVRTHASSQRNATCGMLRPSTYDDAVCVNAAIEINVLDYNIAVRCRTQHFVNGVDVWRRCNRAR